MVRGPAELNRSGLLIGDRLPDLRGPLADGGLFVLSEDAGGLPVALVVADDFPSPAPKNVVVLHVAPPGRSTDPSQLSIIDDGRIADALTGGADGVVLASSDHRVTATGDVADLTTMCARVEPPPAGILRSTSTPLLVVPDVVEEPVRTLLLEHGTTIGFQPSPMIRQGSDGEPVRVLDDPAKARLDLIVDDEALNSLLDVRMVRRLLPEVRRCLGHRIERHEAYKLVRYSPGGGWFDLHRDNTAPGTDHRILAVTINLDDSYDGGDLRFPELGQDRWRPDPGSAIVFSCSLLHEVTPVTSGTRNALITFLS